MLNRQETEIDKCSVHHAHFLKIWPRHRQSTLSRFLGWNGAGVSRNLCVLEDHVFRTTPLDGLVQFSLVQLLSRVPLFVTPWTAACQASLSITNFWSLFKLMSIELVMPSNHLILCRPLLLLPSIFPGIHTKLLKSLWSFWTSQVAVVVKNPPANAGVIREAGAIPGSGSPGGGHGNPHQYSCLENPMDRGAWWATVHGVAKIQLQQKWLSTQHIPALESRHLSHSTTREVLKRIFLTGDFTKETATHRGVWQATACGAASWLKD